MAASMRAVDGDTWVETFVREQSGTYNNEVGHPQRIILVTDSKHIPSYRVADAPMDGAHR